VLLLVAVLAACERAAPAAPAPTRAPSSAPASPSPGAAVSVAYIDDLSEEGAFARTTPAFQAIELAFATASRSRDEPLDVQVVRLDTHGTEFEEVAREVAGDPAFVAAFAAPDLAEQAAIAEILSSADVPLLSLSARGGVEDAPPGTWLRFVPPLRVQARALAKAAASLHAARRGVCLASPPQDGTVVAATVRRALPDDVEVAEAAGAVEVAEVGCGVVVWTGTAEGAAELVRALQPVDGRRPILVGGAGIHGREYVELAPDRSEGSISLCPCADVGTSLDLAAQRFVQDYQSEYGSPPGPFAVEGWDAAQLLARVLRAAGPARSALVTALSGVTRFEGLAGRYAFAGGELADPMAAIRRYRVDGGRWVLLA
jgi:ABC-type branched-subunit amino acid transport system substrate-binding protein